MYSDLKQVSGCLGTEVGGREREGLQSGRRKLLAVTDMFIFLIMMMVS